MWYPTESGAEVLITRKVPHLVLKCVFSCPHKLNLEMKRAGALGFEL